MLDPAELDYFAPMLDLFPPEPGKSSSSVEPQNASSLEFWLAFREKVTFDAWYDANPHLPTSESIEAVVAHVRKNGLVDPFIGHVPPKKIVLQGRNYRETIEFAGAKSRGRAILLLLKEIIRQRGAGLAVYGSEALSPFAERLMALFPSYHGSEYLPGDAKRKFPAIRHEDVQALSFPSACFDIVVSCEVLEHIPFLDIALQESRRVLRGEGIFLGTVPFNVGAQFSTVKARLRDGVVEHLAEPEYHVNPIALAGGSLVFEVPGWDLLHRLRSAGFRDAAMHFVMSSSMGIVSPWGGGVMCFVAQA